MKKTLRKVYDTLALLGFDAKKFLKAVQRKKKLPETKGDWFYADLKEFKAQKGSDKTFEITSLYPILIEKTGEGGTMKGHYFHQDLFVARLIYKAKPKKHLDIGSRVDGFVAHVASFRNIELIDIRDIKSKVHNISFRKADLMELPRDLINCYDSISSLHAIEHFGLGRYGDSIDYLGHLKAINNIHSMLIQNGKFYFSVPIGTQRIEFNAHRIFSVAYLIGILNRKFDIHSFSYVNDQGDFFENCELTEDNIKSNFGCSYGCGIFTLIKN